MKKLLLACVSVLAAVAAYGQGQVNFQNTGPDAVAGTGGTLFTTNGGGIRGANAWRIGLYTAPAGTTTESLFTLTAVATNSALLPGRFSYPGGAFTIAGNNGTAIAYQVRAWSLGLGATYEEAVASGAQGWGSKTAIGSVLPATGGAPPPTLFGPGSGGAPAFAGQLNSPLALVAIGVPEPSTIALGLLGLGAIALFRRRK